MKLLLLAGGLAGVYCYFLLHTTDIAIKQTMQLHTTYQRVSEQADQIAGVNQ